MIYRYVESVEMLPDNVSTHIITVKTRRNASRTADAY